MSLKKSYKEVENEKVLGKKRYLERLAEEDVAKQELDEFLSKREDEHPDEKESHDYP